VVERVVDDRVRPGVWRHDDGRYAEAVAVVAVGGIAGVGPDAVRLDGGGRPDVIEVAAVFVVAPDEQRRRPRRAMQYVVDDRSGEALPQWMSCGVSSEKSTKLGSTMLNAAACHRRRRRKNCLMPRTWRRWRTMLTPKTSAVNWSLDSSS